MFATSVHPNREPKLCPFLVIEEKIPTSMSSKTKKIQKFRDCQEFRCAAFDYETGYCLRLRKE